MKDSTRARLGSEGRGLAESKSRSDSDASSARSDTSSTQSTKSSRATSATSSHTKLSADVKSERSISTASNHYSEEFDEPSVASSREKVDMTVSQPAKAKKSPPSYVTLLTWLRHSE